MSAEKNKNDYKIIISELGFDPFRIVNIIFALMCIIPLLVMIYIIIGKYFLYDLFLSDNGVKMIIAIFIALIGFFYAYNLTRALVEKLLEYAEERRFADSEKTEFMMAVSRDLKIPADVLKTEIGHIKVGIGGLLGNIVEGTIQKCSSAAEKLSDIIGDVMNFSKTEFTRMNTQRELIDLCKIIKGEVNNAAKLAEKKGLSVRYRPACDNANMWGDEKKLAKVVVNLLLNAVSLTPRGGIVKISVTSDAHTIQFSVTNTGPGLSPDEADRIFEKNEKSDKYSEIEDAAVELSVVKDIVDLHNGHIMVRSEPDDETEFKVILPRDLRTRLGLNEGRKEVPLHAPAHTVADSDIGIWLALNKTLKEIIARLKEK